MLNIDVMSLLAHYNKCCNGKCTDVGLYLSFFKDYDSNKDSQSTDD